MVQKQIIHLSHASSRPNSKLVTDLSERLSFKIF